MTLFNVGCTQVHNWYRHYAVCYRLIPRNPTWNLNNSCKSRYDGYAQYHTTWGKTIQINGDIVQKEFFSILIAKNKRDFVVTKNDII